MEEGGGDGLRTAASAYTGRHSKVIDGGRRRRVSLIFTDGSVTDTIFIYIYMECTAGT